MGLLFATTRCSEIPGHARIDYKKTWNDYGIERFLYLMKNLPTFAEKPELWDDPYFNEFMEQATFASMTREEQDAYIASMKQKWDYKNTIDYAREEGREAGREEGREEGEEHKACEIARRMKSMGMNDNVILQATGLTEDQIKAL